MNGLIVLITGGGSGIGAATAKVLQQHGAIPVLVDCDAAPLAQVAAALDGEILTIAADVTSLAQCEHAVAQTLARFGRIDIVWANAGIAAFGPLAYTDPAAWKRCIEVNVCGVFNTVRAALPAIQQSRGYVAVSASLASFAHPPAVSAYAASKAAVEAMCNAWRIELAGHGVGVGVIHAAWVKTPLMTEGSQHPAFVTLQETTPAVLRKAMEADAAARLIVNGFARRARRIWVPGWIRVLHWLRAWLHTPLAERELLRAAPKIEQLFVEGLATSGVKASSQAPRELTRSEARASQN
ncbi:MAG: SDR family NAD(P)-dependent oxidoreductase [Rhodoferax sp.]|nr:SDR family NAD(P)-dependent oxidoreductase [Rhodoferax sp.]